MVHYTAVCLTCNESSPHEDELDKVTDWADLHYTETNHEFTMTFEIVEVPEGKLDLGLS